MPLFRYTAHDATGKTVTGETPAEGPAELQAQLGQRGLTLETAALSAVEAQQFGSAVAALTRAGLPLETGLRILSEEVPAGRLRRLLRTLSCQLQSGQTLEQVMDAMGERVPAHLRRLLAGGVRSGQLPAALEDYVLFSQRLRQNRLEIWFSLLYPLVLLAAIGSLTIFLLVILVPQFKSIYRDFGIELPFDTLFLIELSDFVIWFMPKLVFVVPGILLSLWLLRQTVAAAWIIDLVPFIGRLRRWSGQVSLLRLLALLLEQQTPLPEALRLASAGCEEPLVRRQSRKASAEAETGTPPATVVVRAIGSAELGPLLAWGERSQALPDSLRAVADMLESRIRTHAALARSVLPGGLFFLVILGAGWTIFALLVPLIRLLNALGQ